MRGSDRRGCRRRERTLEQDSRGREDRVHSEEDAAEQLEEGMEEGGREEAGEGREARRGEGARVVEVGEVMIAATVQEVRGVVPPPPAPTTVPPPVPAACVC